MNQIDYFNGKLIIYGTGAIGCVFLLSSTVVFFTNSRDASMYVLILGVLCITVVIVALKLVGRYWHNVYEDVENVVLVLEEEVDRIPEHPDHPQQLQAEKPPSYTQALRTETPPPSFEDAVTPN